MVQTAQFWIILFASVAVFWLLPQRLRYGFVALVSIVYLSVVAPAGALPLLAWCVVFFVVAPRALVWQTTSSSARSTPLLASAWADVGSGRGVATMPPRVTTAPAAAPRPQPRRGIVAA